MLNQSFCSKLKSTICVFTALCCFLSFSACDTQNDDIPAPSDTAPEQTSTHNSRAPFEDMPEIDTPDVRIHAGDGTLLYEYVTPGMDSCKCTLINYSLDENRILGLVDAGEGDFSISTCEGGGFAVFDAVSSEGRYYSRECRLLQSTDVGRTSGGKGFILPGENGENILFSELESGALYLTDRDGKDKTAVNIAPGAYEPVGIASGRFTVVRDGSSVCVIEQSGAVRELFSNGGVAVCGSDFAAGRIGDYLALFPFDNGDRLFIKTADADETPVSAGIGALLTLSSAESGSVLRLYDLRRLVYTETSLNTAVKAAAMTDRCAAVVCKGKKGFDYKLVNVFDGSETPFTADGDISAVLGYVKLPQTGDGDEVDLYTKEIAAKYNVRFLYEESEFIGALESFGIKAELLIDRERILHIEKQLVSSFEFLPDAVWKDIGDGMPYVVILCSSLTGNLGGIFFEFGGHSCIFLEATGNDPYYTELFMHETGHAINHRVFKSHPEMKEGWLELTPEQVRNAVEKGTLNGVDALTVEFTPYDKTGNVCYVSDYALSSPEEDRAETFSKFYDAIYRENDHLLFSHSVLKNKALYLSEMIRKTFPIPADTPLPFDLV